MVEKNPEVEVSKMAGSEEIDYFGEDYILKRFGSEILWGLNKSRYSEQRFARKVDEIPHNILYSEYLIWLNALRRLTNTQYLRNMIDFEIGVVDFEQRLSKTLDLETVKYWTQCEKGLEDFA